MFIYIVVLFMMGFNLCLCFEESWQSYYNGFKTANREELTITNVTADESFKINANVKKWTSLSIGFTCYSIGIMDTGLAILFSNIKDDDAAINIKSEIKELKAKPLEVVLLQNRTLHTMEAIVVVAFQNELKLEWYKIRETKLELFWTWTLTTSILHINAFSVNNKRVLLIASIYNENSTSVDLYQYEIRNKSKYWFWHSLDVSTPVTSSAFNSFEFDSFLSLPQKSSDLVSVFKHEEDRFVPYTNIISQDVEAVVSFEIGFQSFLAINGLHAGMYQFTNHGLENETLENSNMDAIEFWMPVPVKTYRDDVIVLAQRNLNYATHHDYVIEIITYNGAKFEEHEDIPCTHFGEKTQWLTCLSEENGIIGSSFIAVGDRLGLIVPRPSNTSLMFNVQYEIREMSNPLEAELKKLLSEKETIQSIIDTQIKDYEGIKKVGETFEMVDGISSQALLSRQSNGGSLSQQFDDIAEEIEDIKGRVHRIMEKKNRTDFDVLTINGVVKIEGEGKFKEIAVEKLGGEPAKELLEDLVRKDSIQHIPGEKVINNLNVDHIVFDKVNGIPADEIVFYNNSPINLSGNITVHGTAEVKNVHVLTGLINNVDFVNEIVDVRNRDSGFLNFSKVKVNNRFYADEINDKLLQLDESNASSIVNMKLDSVRLPNLTVTNINGVHFDNFYKQLCLVNVNCYIGDLKINGNITTEKATTYSLNNLKFPEEFVFRKSDGTSPVITGRKIFKNSLVAREIKSRGKIDGVDMKKLITLSTNQPEIPGTITFQDIEVVEHLNVTGHILGDQIDKFLPNPTLEFAKNISANVNFTKLEVEGNIIIEHDFNNSNFKMLLDDLIYKDTPEVNILAQKIFPQGFSVEGNLEIGSNSINNVSLDSLVTKDTDQVLNITLLKGNVVIDNVEVGGSFDGENITQIDQDVVKIDGEQHITSTLTFTEDVKAENFEVTRTLNNDTIESYLLTYGGKEIDTDIRFKDIIAENITVEGNVTGDIAGFDIKDFSEKYLSYNKDQSIHAHYDIVHSSIDNLKADDVNGEDYEDFFSASEFAEEIAKKLRSGKVAVRNLYVKGQLYIDSINGKDQNQWLPRDELKEANGTYKKHLNILGDVYFNTLEIDRIGGVNWTWLNGELVWKNESNLVISAPHINFSGGVKVTKLVETKKINGIPIENILTKQGQQTIDGPLTIKGDVVIKDKVNISENLNEMAVRDLLNKLDIENGTYAIKGSMVFNRLVRTYNLDVGELANKKNITDYLSHVVYLDKDSSFSEEFVFQEPVVIGGNLAIQGNLNGIDLSDIGSQIVLTTNDAQIQGRVTFTQPVIVHDHLAVDGDLNTGTLYRIDLAEWKNNCVYLDRGRIEGTFTFDEVIIKDNLLIKKLNGIDIKSIIPLKTNQTLDQFEFGEVVVTNNISVLGSVNGYANLSHEFGITVMADKDQKINSNVTFNKVILVRENLSTNFINGIDVSKMVTTNTDQNLTSPFNFSAQCKIDSDLWVHGFVQGINMADWKDRSLKMFSKEVQRIGNVGANITFVENVEGKGFLSDLNLTKVMEEVEGRKNYKLTAEHGVIEDYKGMCVDVTYFHEALKKQIYKFKYFERLDSITLKNQIQYVHYVQFRDDHYLIINDDMCSSLVTLYTGSKFEQQYATEMGHISQAITVQGNDSFFFVTRSGEGKKNCKVEGTNVWRFNEDTIELLYSMDEQDLLQESAIPFTFYGLNKQGVAEYKIGFSVPRKYRTWKVSEENVAFMPRGLKTGLSLRTGQKIIFLVQSDPVVDDYSDDVEYVTVGSTREEVNSFIPGRNGGDLVVARVGIESARQNLLAVATHEETSVRGRLDFIKIYSDALKGEVFHKVPAYNPSSLLSIDFDQGETLLVFMENGNTLQVFEYKGIQGFQHRTSARVHGSKLFLMTLPIQPFLNPRKVIGIVHKNKINLMYSVMAGNRIRDDLKCGL